MKLRKCKILLVKMTLVSIIVILVLSQADQIWQAELKPDLETLITLPQANSTFVFQNIAKPFILGRFIECHKEAKMLVFVHSTPTQMNERNTVRNTWGNRRLFDQTKAQIFFVIGSTANENLVVEQQRRLQWEQDIHNDLIQGHFQEEDPSGLQEQLLSDLKSLLWLRWSEKQCPTVPYILKVNMETFVDLIALSTNLIRAPSNNSSCLICLPKPVSTSSGETRNVCQKDVYLMDSSTRDLMLYKWLDLPKPMKLASKAESHFVSNSLASLSGVGLVSQDNFVWGPETELPFGMQPIVQADKDLGPLTFEKWWHKMLEEHQLDPPPEPVFLSNFSTTSHQNYTINNPDFCTRIWPDLETLVVVHSNPLQFDFRDWIRRTWGDPRIYPLTKLRPLFFVGRVADPAVERSLREESSQFGDIIQTDFLDTYKNLTFKAISWMQWVEQHCPNVPYLVKSDDDMLIDVFKLRKYLLMKISSSQDPRKIHCYYWSYGRIERNPNKKHFVSWHHFKEKRFPAYCSGSAFILTPFISQLLLEDFRRDPTYLWVDDVFITGVLAKRARVSHKSIGYMYTFSAGSLKKPTVQNRFVFAHLSGQKSHSARQNYWNEILAKHNVTFKDGLAYQVKSDVMPRQTTVEVSVSDEEWET